MADNSGLGRSLYNYIKRQRYIMGGDRHHLNYYMATLVKNYRPFLNQLNLQRKMPVHEGCVNTLAWNQYGQYILSGSDDCYLCITKPNLCDFNERNYRIQHKILSGHNANIFSAQFMPFTSDTKITSCSSSGSIIVTDVNSPETSGTSRFECHRYTCYEVAPIPNHADVFLSCSEDKTVRLFDLRTTQSCGGSNCQKNILIRGGYSMTTISINPMNPEQFLVGRSDGLGILFDRRNICKDSDLSYHHSQQQQRCETQAANRQSDNNGDQSQNLDKLKVRGLNHPQHGAVTKFTVPGFTDTHRFTSLCFSPDGRQVLASYSSDYIYLFDTDRSSNITLKNCLNKTTPKPPPHGGSDGGDDDKDDQMDSPNDQNRMGWTSSSSPRRTFRVRGDWSDTGPNSRPMGVSTASEGDEAEIRDQRQSFMSRLTRAASSLLINSPHVEEGLRTSRDDPTRPVFIGVGDILRRSSTTAHTAVTRPPDSADSQGTTTSTSSSRVVGAGRTDDDNEPDSTGLWISAMDELSDVGENDEEDNDEDGDDDDDDISIPDFMYNIQRHHARAPIREHQNQPDNSSGKIAPSSGDSHIRSGSAASTSSPSNRTSQQQPASTPLRPPINRGKNISQATKDKFSQSFKKALEAVMQIPSYQPKKSYKGHRNCRTAIKEATFWGSDYIVSGSDCGHVFVWDKFTGEVMMIFQGDERVVNCVAPNPLHYCLATSGIDYDIKLWSTQSHEHEPLFKTEQNIQKIIRINEQMIQEDLHTITMPPHFFFRVLASLASARIDIGNVNDAMDY